MAVMTKQNGTAKKETATVKKEVQQKLAQEATGKTATIKPVEKPTIQQVEAPVINLDDRMHKFEKIC